MTELEKKIYDCAMEIIQDAKSRVKKIKTERRYIEIPFYCDGCLDYLLYDKEQEKFTKITYLKGRGVGIFGGMSDFSAFFDDVERCEIDISIPFKKL